MNLTHSYKSLNVILGCFAAIFQNFVIGAINFESIQFHVNHSTETEYFRNHFCYFKKNTKHHISVYQDFGIQLDTFDRDNWSSSWKKIMESKTYEPLYLTKIIFPS